MANIRQRIEHLIHHLQQGIYEKDTETALALLAALAGESILLLGPPGVAKSMVARRLKEAFKGAKSFEYLMSRFSTPDEIFGPISIARLKEDDKYERAITGYLPTADVVFLDEIWKAGPAIQNTLLTVMNEKLFRNGDKELKLPLKLLIAASNELPAKGEGLEALWDRFVIRVVCRCIQNETTFRHMLCDDEHESAPTPPPTAQPITNREFSAWQKEAKKVRLNSDLLEAITYVRLHLQRVEVEGTELPRSIYISDRRWKHIAALLRTSAYVQERNEATVVDLLPMYHCLWNEPEELHSVKQITIEALFAPYKKGIEQLAASVKANLRACRAKAALAKAAREHDHRDDDLLIVNNFFYQIENHGTGHTYVFITDYKSMPLRSNNNAPAQGVIYKDPMNKARSIVRLYDADALRGLPANEREQVTLCRDNDHIYINGIAFKMRHKGAAVLNPSTGQIGGLFEGASQNATTNDARYEEKIETLCNALEQIKHDIDNHLFVNDDDKKQADGYLQQLYKEIALCRVDIRKLLYDE